MQQINLHRELADTMNWSTQQIGTNNGGCPVSVFQCKIDPHAAILTHTENTQRIHTEYSRGTPV